MRNLNNPKWLLLINTLPICILFWIYFGVYQIVKTLLPPETLHQWMVYGGGLAALALPQLGYTILLIRKKRTIHRGYGFLALAAYISYLYLYILKIDTIIPHNIPVWMLPQELALYPGTFLMPTIAHALFFLVESFTPKDKSHQWWTNFLMVIGIPLFWYVFFQMLLPIMKYRCNDPSVFSFHLMVVFFIVGTILFLFFLARGIFVLTQKRSEKWRNRQLYWKIPIAFVFPLLGLTLSNGLIDTFIEDAAKELFGNFSSPWFYIIAGLNGIAICLPDLKDKNYRSILFIVRSIGLSYVLYFFMVFLPFLPLSIIAILVIGFGFLMLTPVLLMVLQAQSLTRDYNFLKQYYSGKRIRLVFLGSILVLPLTITGGYYHQRKVLDEALDYVYSPNLENQSKSPIDTTSLKKVLDQISQNKKRDTREIHFCNLPFLTPYYNWLVLDNLTLSNTKIVLLEKLFMGKTTHYVEEGWTPDASNNIEITDIKVRSSYNKEKQTWRSWVMLKLTHKGTWLGEFKTHFNLPAGCWISDYYLWVKGLKEPGILAEKKTATWIYKQITSYRRDPGILHYTSGNTVAFNVFPFEAQETRETGFEILHKEPVSLELEGHTIFLGDNLQATPSSAPIESKNKLVTYIPASVKKGLPTIKRKPYYHFIIDCSKGEEAQKESYIQKIESFLHSHQGEAQRSRFSFVNAGMETLDYKDAWKEHLQNYSLSGGFFLERALETELIHNYHCHSKDCPIFIVISKDFSKALFTHEDLKNLQLTFPDNNLFYELKDKGELALHSLSMNPMKSMGTVVNPTPLKEVFTWSEKDKPMTYLYKDNQPGIVYTNNREEAQDLDPNQKDWMDALTLYSHSLSQYFHPEDSEKEWRKLVRNSFKTKVMMPVTSYLVVENEAQRAFLKKKQEEVLSGKKSLDLGEEPEQMSEPSLLVILSLILLFLLFRERKKIKDKISFPHHSHHESGK